MQKGENLLYTSLLRLGVNFRTLLLRNQFRHIVAKMDSDETKKINSLIEEFVNKNSYLLNDFEQKYNDYEAQRKEVDKGEGDSRGVES
jgi:hypothetical protein